MTLSTTSPGDERAEYEQWLRSQHKARFWNTSDAMFAAWQAGRASSSPVQQVGAEWISVSERQPEPGSTVLAFWEPRSGPVTNQCWGLASYWPGHWHNPEDDEDDYCAPTFWRRLPARPSTQGDQQ